MKPIKLVTPISGDPEAPTQNLVGLGALAAELAAEGVSVRDLFARTGVDAAQLEDARARISHRQRLAIYRNAKRSTRYPIRFGVRYATLPFLLARDPQPLA